MTTPTTTIDSLPAVTAVTGTQLLVIQEAGTTKKGTVDALGAYFGSSGTGSGGTGIVIDDEPPTDTDVLWADTDEVGAGPIQTVSVHTYTDDTDVRPDATVVFWIPDPFDLPNPLAAQPGDCVLRSTPNVISSATGLTAVEHYTVSGYDAIATPDPNTVYLIVADP